MENLKKEFVFFNKGDIVRLKQDIENKPSMVVKKPLKSKFKNDDKVNLLLGIVCFWFNTQGTYQESVFDTKDLEKV